MRGEAIAERRGDMEAPIAANDTPMSSGRIATIRRRRRAGDFISLRDFRERLVEKAAAEARERLFEEMDRLGRPSADTTPSIEILRELRGRG